MSDFDWIESYPNAVTVCDREGFIIAMNQASRHNFRKRGGADLIGSSLYDCHSIGSGEIIRTLIREERSNTYIVNRKNRRRLVHQAPWYRDGVFGGLVETIIDLPEDLLPAKANEE
ncbi:PAS domain-containing protein [Desulfolithobacter sp.]